jgi:CheY-like chemotaxis protein
MSQDDPTTFGLEGVDLLANALHARLLQQRRATLDHDMKNIVHGLLSGTELLSKALSTSTARISPSECVTLLQQQLTRAQATLARILEEIAPAELGSSEVELTELVGACTHSLRHQLQSLSVNTALQQTATVRVHASRFKDALMLLLLDCVDQSPLRSRLELGTSLAQDHVVLRIEHTLRDSPGGPGHLPMLRELFATDGVQLEIGTAERQRSIALMIPRIATAGDATAIVIVDGNRDAADSLAMLAELEGFAATAAYDIESTLAAVKQRTLAAILIDLDGSIDSQSLLRRLRAEASGIQLIGLSYSQSPASAEADTYLGKPLDIRALRKALRKDA